MRQRPGVGLPSHRGQPCRIAEQLLAARPPTPPASPPRATSPVLPSTTNRSLPLPAATISGRPELAASSTAFDSSSITAGWAHRSADA